MKKYIIVLALILGLVGSLPLLVKAQGVTIDEIITALRNNPKLLQEVAQLLGLNNQSGGRWCHDFNRDIKIGDNDDEVKALHTALNHGDESSDFDEQSASQVVAFQEEHADEILKPIGLSHGSGYVGPATRRFLNKTYGCGTTKPIAHASVRVLSPNGGEVWPQGSNQVITWATSPGYSIINTGASAMPGTVTIYLASASMKFRLMVAANVPNTGSYPWLVGRVMTYDTASQISDGAYYVQVCLTRGASEPADQLCDRSDNYFKIGSGTNTGNQPPVISGVSGPTTLAVGATGTWTVQASDPENGPLSYSVHWGDELDVYAQTGSASTVSPVQQSTTFTHSYATALMHYPTFTVTDNAGQSAKTSISVQVGDVTSSTLSITMPQSDTTWPIGSSQTVRWQFNGGSFAIPSTAVMTLSLINGPTPGVLGTPGLTVGSGGYTLTVQNVVVGGDAVSQIQPGVYQVVATLYDKQPCFGMCQAVGVPAQVLARAVSPGRVTITSGTTQPNITVTSPNGGETWAANSVRTISWRFGPTMLLSADPKVDLYLDWDYYCTPVPGTLICDARPQPVSYTLDKNIAGNAAYNWIVATDINNNPISAGQYQIRVCLAGSTSNCDSSDQPFSIVSGTTQSPAITALSPMSGLVSSQVTITGSGFTPTGNRVKFGNVNSENVPSYNLNSSNGTTLVFIVPSFGYFCDTHINICPSFTPPLRPDVYAVSIINGNGVSNPVNFTVTAS